MSVCHSAAETSLNATEPTEALERTTAGFRSRRSMRLFLRSDSEPPALTRVSQAPLFRKRVSPVNKYVFPSAEPARKHTLPGVWPGVGMTSMLPSLVSLLSNVQSTSAAFLTAGSSNRWQQSLEPNRFLISASAGPASSLWLKYWYVIPPSV